MTRGEARHILLLGACADTPLAWLHLQKASANEAFCCFRKLHGCAVTSPTGCRSNTQRTGSRTLTSASTSLSYLTHGHVTASHKCGQLETPRTAELGSRRPELQFIRSGFAVSAVGLMSPNVSGTIDAAFTDPCAERFARDQTARSPLGDVDALR